MAQNASLSLVESFGFFIPVKPSPGVFPSFMFPNSRDFSTGRTPPSATNTPASPCASGSRITPPRPADEHVLPHEPVVHENVSVRQSEYLVKQRLPHLDVQLAVIYGVLPLEDYPLLEHLEVPGG